MGFLNLQQHAICHNSIMWRGLGTEEKELADLVKNIKLGQEKLRQNYTPQMN